MHIIYVKLLITSVDFSFLLFYELSCDINWSVCVLQIHCSKMLLNMIISVTLQNFKADHVHNMSLTMSISNCVNIAACAVSVFAGMLYNFEA